MFSRLSQWFLLACVLVAAPARAEVYALLVGVADYDDSTGIADLRGPPNDVALLRSVLLRRGVSQIVTLADGTAQSPRPTRAAILAALDELIGRVSAGDFVFLHFSGHGTRQRDQNGDETDGLDEVFLPADAGPADPATGLISQGLADDEIGSAVSALRSKGVDVWLVMDNCHAGSGLRAGAPQIADRYVDPVLLGVSNATARIAEPSPVALNDPDLPGGVIAFYAAQSTEVAREVDLSGDGEWYGLFTAKLAARLDQPGANTFRQLFQGVMTDLNDQTVPGAARLQTPLWEGTLIDATLFGGSESNGPSRYVLNGDQMAAGLVHGLSKGTLVGLVADVTDPADAVIGVAQITDIGATQADLRAVDPDCEPVAASLCPALGNLPETSSFAQLLARPLDMTVRIARPRQMNGAGLLETSHPAYQALQSALAERTNATAVPIMISPDDFDVDALWDGEAIWFAPRAIIGDTPVGLRWAMTGQDLAPLLDRMATAEQLARLLQSSAGAPSLLNPNPITVAGRLARSRVADLVPASAGISPRQECRAAAAGRDNSAPVALTEAQTVKQCDAISLSVTGSDGAAIDVNRVHIDAQYCIHASHERIEGDAAPRQLGPDMTMCSDCPGGVSAGDERLFVVTTEALAGRAPLNLSGLVENCDLPAGATRGGAALAGFLDTLASPRTMRSSQGATGTPSVWVTGYHWSVLPKAEVFARAGIVQP